MKTTLLFLTCLLALLVCLLPSCSITKSRTAKSYDIYGNGVIQRPVIADLVVNETKVTGFSSTTSSNHENAKQFAIADALEKTNADVLVEPKFFTETKNGKTTITVTGYPATYKNFRPVVAEDSTLVRIGEKQIAKTTNPITTKNNGGIIAAIAILGVVGSFLFGALLFSY